MFVWVVIDIHYGNEGNLGIRVFQNEEDANNEADKLEEEAIAAGTIIKDTMIIKSEKIQIQ